MRTSVTGRLPLGLAAVILLASTALGGRPASSRTLAALRAELERARGPAIVALDARYLAAIGQASGRTPPRGATLRALVVRSPTAMLGAFLAIAPPGHKRCSEEAAEQARVLWLPGPGTAAAPGPLRLTEAPTRAFDGLKPTVELPDLYPKVPFFTVEYAPSCENLPPGGGSEYDDVQVVEVWRLAPGAPSSPGRFRSYRHIPAGTTLEVSVDLTWIAGRQQTYYLQATSFSQRRTPLTSAPIGAADEERGYFISCERRSQVYALTPAGGWTALVAARLAALRTQDPALRKIPRDADAGGKSTETSLPRCDALKP